MFIRDGFATYKPDLIQISFSGDLPFFEMLWRNLASPCPWKIWRPCLIGDQWDAQEDNRQAHYSGKGLTLLLAWFMQFCDFFWTLLSRKSRGRTQDLPTLCFWRGKRGALIRDKKGVQGLCLNLTSGHYFMLSFGTKTKFWHTHKLSFMPSPKFLPLYPLSLPPGSNRGLT